MATSPRNVDLLLYTFKDMLIATVADNDRDLSSRQMATFLHVYLDNPPDGHTVRGIAALLNVSKPAITRALDRLGELDYVVRTIDSNDRRSVIVKRTATGSAFLRTLSKHMQNARKTTQAA
jgi:DNA-binding MarR family transcriptional regulator